LAAPAAPRRHDTSLDAIAGADTIWTPARNARRPAAWFTGASMDVPAGSLLAVARSRERSVVTRARSAAPLRLLAPASPGRAAWVYQSSLGGGYVGRDAIALAVDVAAGARLFLTSQASSKVYRGSVSSCRIDAAIGDGGVIVAWPDPIVCCAGAAFDQRQRFRLGRGAGLIAVDAWTAGRIAHGECWAFARLALATEVELEGAPVVTDAVVLDAAHGDLGPRMADARALATIVIAGAPFAAALPQIAQRLAGHPVTAQPRISASLWPWGAVIRIAATTTEQLAHATQALIGAPVRDALGADPFVRKW
jgi:urease accessory protein